MSKYINKNLLIPFFNQTRSVLYALITLFILNGFVSIPGYSQGFTAGNLVLVQTSGAVSKGASPVTLVEYTTSGTAGNTIVIPATGSTPLQMAAGPGGSEGFLTRSTDGKFIVLAGYSTSATTTDITATTSSSAPRVIFTVDGNGTYTQVGSSSTNYNANDIRGAVSDGTNFWASGASTTADGIDYYGPGTPVALGTGATPVKAYGLQIFNGQIYYSTQKAGPNNTTAHLGIFALGSGLPTSGSTTSTQIIDVGATALPTDFSFNPAGDVCYIAINVNSAIGGIQKWTNTGGTWSLAYTLGTGATNIGAYGLTVDYTGSDPLIYATTFETNTVGNRIIKITDTGSGSVATTLATAPANTWFHGIAFAPCNTPQQPGDFTSSSATVTKGQTSVTYTVPNDVKATNYSWDYSGTGATINGSGNSVTIDFSSTATSGTLTVSAVNSCGTSSAKSISITVNQPGFTSGRIVALQTSGTASKTSSPVTLVEYGTDGKAGFSVAIPATGNTPFQTAGVFGGSEGFLTTSTDGKFLVVAGYGTSSTFSDITGTTSTTVPRVVGMVTPTGVYNQIASSTSFYSGNDIRGAISDGTNYWAAGASNATDGINYYGPGTQLALGVGAKAYGLRIFNNQIYYSTQKAGPTNTASQLGIFSLGSGTPTSGTASPTQIINTGTLIPEDFSFNPSMDVCYVAINLNTASGGIQKWTNNGGTWTLAYTLGTGIANIGAYGLVVDYSGANPIIYATTFESTGNRIISILDNGSSATATTLVPATSGVIFHGITFVPVDNGNPSVTLSISTNSASEASATQVTLTANASSAVSGDQTVTLDVSGTGITAGDYTLSNTTITIPDGSLSGSVTFTVIDDTDIEGTETAILLISNPSTGISLGSVTSQNIVIADNDANNPPTIAMDVSSTSNFIDEGIATSPTSPFAISGVINDPTDPVSSLGIDFTISDIETVAGNLTVTVTTSNSTVVPNSNILLSGSGNSRNVKITPAAVGYSTITVTVNDGTNNNTNYLINYAASVASATPSATFWHTGMSDASDGIVLDDDYFISGDDELDVLNVYSRSASGLLLVSYNYASYLALPDPSKPEVDLEAATRSTINASRVYWMGSLSNAKAPFENRPNRDRLFATSVTGTGAGTSFTTVGYCALRNAIIAWGDAYGYNFTASAAAGKDSKLVDGFAVEGMVFGPDNTTLYIGMRAPLVPTTTRTKAVIVPILNFESWFNNGTQSGNPTFGSPIELDMGGRGFRDIIRLSNGTYVIIAGNPGGSPITSAIYKWTGNASDAPIMVPSSVSGILNLEGVMPVNEGGQLSLDKLEVISDGGDEILYNDGSEAKDFGDLSLRKFRSDLVSSLDLTLTTTGITASTDDFAALNVFPNPFNQQITLNYQLKQGSKVSIELLDITGKQIAKLADQQQVNIGSYQLSINTSEYRLASGLYLIKFTTETGSQLIKVNHVE